MVNLVGARIERKEDKKFLTGKGRYTADINLLNQAYAYFVRSPHARAKIIKVDHSKAMKAWKVLSFDGRPTLEFRQNNNILTNHFKKYRTLFF